MYIVILALSMAFFFVEILSPLLKLNFKPFNCIKCMTGWYALFIGWYFLGGEGTLYLFIGLFAGAIFEAIKMRYL